MIKTIKNLLSGLLLVFGTLGFGQSLTIEGKVLSDDNQPLDQATVQILNLKWNLFTAAHGKFSVNLESDEIKNLHFLISYTGCDRLDTTVQKVHLLDPLIFQLSC